MSAREMFEALGFYYFFDEGDNCHGFVKNEVIPKSNNKIDKVTSIYFDLDTEEMFGFIMEKELDFMPMGLTVTKEMFKAIKKMFEELGWDK